MKCNKTYDFFGYLEDKLSSRLKSEIGKHLATCETCSYKVEQIKLVLQTIDLKKEKTASPYLFTRINEALEIRAKKSTAYIKVLKPVFVTCIIIIAFACGIAVGNYYQTSINSNSTSSLYWNDASQEPIETALLSE